MASRTIPKEHWRDELDAFSRDHEGWRVDVRVSTPGGETRTEAHGLPLVGVSCDAPGSSRIAVIAGERTDDNVTHEIPNAVAVDLDPACISIRGADGSETKIAFQKHS